MRGVDTAPDLLPLSSSTAESAGGSAYRTSRRVAFGEDACRASLHGNADFGGDRM